MLSQPEIRLRGTFIVISKLWKVSDFVGQVLVSWRLFFCHRVSDRSQASV